MAHPLGNPPQPGVSQGTLPTSVLGAGTAGGQDTVPGLLHSQGCPVGLALAGCPKPLLR